MDNKRSTPQPEFAPDYSTHVPSQETAELSLPARVEGLLFVSSSPVSVSQLASALRVTNTAAERALESLEQALGERGLRLQRHQGKIQLTTAPQLAEDVQRFLDLESTSRLTRAALEVLSIVAYQQPATRPQIDAVRGVNSDSVLRTLLRHGLIEEVDRSEGPGRPFLYATTPEFLQHFGLPSLDSLPPLVLDDASTKPASDSTEDSEA